MGVWKGKGQDQEVLSICMPAGGDADDQDPQCLMDSRRFSQHKARETSLPSLDTASALHVTDKPPRSWAFLIQTGSDEHEVLKEVGTKPHSRRSPCETRRNDNAARVSHASSGRVRTTLRCTRRRLTLGLSLVAHVARCHGGRDEAKQA